VHTIGARWGVEAHIHSFVICGKFHEQDSLPLGTATSAYQFGDCLGSRIDLGFLEKRKIGSYSKTNRMHQFIKLLLLFFA
jgi:hypothetical protein